MTARTTRGTATTTSTTGIRPAMETSRAWPTTPSRCSLATRTDRRRQSRFASLSTSSFASASSAKESRRKSTITTPNGWGYILSALQTQQQFTTAWDGKFKNLPTVPDTEGIAFMGTVIYDDILTPGAAWGADFPTSYITAAEPDDHLHIKLRLARA